MVESIGYVVVLSAMWIDRQTLYDIATRGTKAWVVTSLVEESESDNIVKSGPACHHQATTSDMD